MIIPIIAGIIILLILVFSSLYYLGNVANDFFRQADELEKDIREGKDKNDVIKRLYELKEKSFHRHTGTRIRELAIMIEIKYDIKILKR
jgi:hypothetical protein